jgi:hypothetical protein
VHGTEPVTTGKKQPHHQVNFHYKVRNEWNRIEEALLDNDQKRSTPAALKLPVGLAEMSGFEQARRLCRLCAAITMKRRHRQ